MLQVRTMSIVLFQPFTWEVVDVKPPPEQTGGQEVELRTLRLVDPGPNPDGPPVLEVLVPMEVALAEKMGANLQGRSIVTAPASVLGNLPKNGNGR